jgi:hypothetical protein
MHIIDFFKQNYIFQKNGVPKWEYNLLYKFAGIVNFFLPHVKSKPDIFIFSSFRSGSTWLAELIYKFSGVKYVQEPLSSSKRKILKNINPIIPSNTYTLPDIIENEEIFKKYIKKLSKGKYVISRRYDFLSSSFNIYTNRSVFKILRGSALINWFLKHFKNDYFIILIRHPIATSISKIKTGITKDFFKTIIKYNNDETYKKLLKEGVLEQIIKEKSTYTLLEQNVIIWCLDNLPLLYNYKNHNGNNILLITYEELVLDTEFIIYKLSKEFDLSTPTNKIHDLHSKSASTIYNKTQIVDFTDRNKLLNTWRKEITNDEEQRIFDIIKMFDIDIYSYESDLPVNKYLHKK